MKALNGRIIAQGEAHGSRAKALRAAHAVVAIQQYELKIQPLSGGP